MEIVRYYANYDSGTPTELWFRGRIEKPSKRRENVLITGRTESLFVMGQDINVNYVNEDVGAAIKDLFDTYGQGRFDTSSIDTSTGILITLTFSGIAFSDAITDLCFAAGYDCWVDPDLVVQFFLSGSIINADEGIVHEYNEIEVGDFAPDISQVKNQIRIVGGTVDGVQVIYTANDTASQTAYGKRRKNVNDDGIITFEAAEELGEYLLQEEKTPPETGTIQSIHLATVQPGEKMQISSPMNGIVPGKYRVVHYKHDIKDGHGLTTVTINKSPRRISHVMRNIIQREHKKTGASINQYDLDFTKIELFNTPSGSLEDATIADGVLKVEPGSTQGTWISAVYDADIGVSEISVDIVGDNLPGVTIDVSTDGGNTYDTITRGELKTISRGSKIVVKLSLVGESAQVDSMKIQYST